MPFYMEYRCAQLAWVRSSLVDYVIHATGDQRELTNASIDIVLPCICIMAVYPSPRVST